MPLAGHCPELQDELAESRVEALLPRHGERTQGSRL